MRRVFRSTTYKVITNTIKVLLILIMLIYIVLMSIQVLSLKGNVFGYRFFNITDTSMAKKYKVGDIVVVEKTDTNQLKVTNDIAYKGNSEIDPDKLIIHRIVKKEKDEHGKYIIVTKGLNSSFNDPPITDKNIIGKVIGILPVVSEFNHLLKNQLMFLLLIIIPALVIIILDIIKTLSDIKAEKLETSLY